MRNVIKALGKGVLKIMSKMGISTVSSYAGAQAFEAVGLSQAFVDQYFTGTTSKLGGVGIDVIAAENDEPARLGVPGGRRRHARTSGSPPAASTSGAATAHRTCSTPRRSSGCSTPPAPAATTSSANTPGSSTTRPKR